MDSKKSLNLLVLGGTGKTGKAIIKFALKAGHKVRSLTRNVDKAPKFQEGNVEWYQGSVLDKKVLLKVLDGVDGVLSAIGPDGMGATTLYSDSIKVIYEAMKEKNVKRFLGVTATRESTSFGFLDRQFLKFIISKVLADQAAMEEWMEKQNDKDIEFTMIRPFRIFEKPFTGKYRVGPADAEPKYKKESHTEDIADFMLKEFSENKYVNQFVSLSL
mmetsp:Transcript_26639/g.23605  ORF Transcript_26639/g.23605 Transcript_26639/m.23605 type:complete len:216 (+) Transcript_26639:48-695(+)